MVKERHVVYAHGHKYTNCLRLVINQPLFILVVVFFYAVYNKKISLWLKALQKRKICAYVHKVNKNDAYYLFQTIKHAKAQVQSIRRI